MHKQGFFQRIRGALSRLASDHAARSGSNIDEDGVAHATADWQPQDTPQRIEIMITGDPSRVGVVADAVDAAQQALFGKDKTGRVKLRMTGFLDRCLHRSKWTRKPLKAAAQARNWHCEQSETRYADAFAKSSGEMVDAIILIGHRFDDDMSEALRQAQILKEQGVKIYCFHTGTDAASRAAYERLAEETDGVFMQLPDQNAIGEIMPVLMSHFNNAGHMDALTPASPTVRRLQDLLKAQAHVEISVDDLKALRDATPNDDDAI